jgi:hypothetical protein
MADIAIFCPDKLHSYELDPEPLVAVSWLKRLA